MCVLRHSIVDWFFSETQTWLAFLETESTLGWLYSIFGSRTFLLVFEV